MNDKIIVASKEDEDLEFHRRVGGPKEFGGADGLNSVPTSEACDCDDCVESRREVGDFVQYARFGQGFLPATQTTKTLAPGLYDVEATQQGNLFTPRPLVTDRLLRLPDSRSNDVITEIEKFWPLKERFKSFGLTHKRGILLWGPPGSGKTATVSFVIKQMVENGGLVVLANDTHPIIVADALGDLREIEPERQLVVVMEDIDTIIENYGESAVLSLLDGENSINNVVFLATTNYPENLDGRVVNRPSRFDRVVKIGMPNAAARKMYLESRDITDEIDIDAWVAATDGFSIAHLKELIIGVCCYGNSFKTEIERLRRMFNKVSSSDGERGIGFGHADGGDEDDD